MTREYEFVKEALRFMFKENVFGFRDAMPEEFKHDSAAKVVNDASVEIYIADGDGSEIQTTVENLKAAVEFDEYKKKAAALLLKYGDVVSQYTEKG